MEWLALVVAGVAAGLLLWPLGGTLARVPVLARRPADAFRALRFWRVYSIRPSRDPDIHALLRPVIDRHLGYLREQVSHAERDLEQLRASHPQLLIETRRTIRQMESARRKLARAQRQLELALDISKGWSEATPKAIVPIEPQSLANLEPALEGRPRRRRATVVSGNGQARSEKRK